MSLIDGVSDADIQKFEIDDSIVSDNQVIGSFNLNLATIQLINLNKKYSHLKGQWIDTLMGRLYVYEAPEKQGDITIELKCYDLAYKFDDGYIAPLEFPATVGQWLEAICQKVGVELGTPTFTNSDAMLGSQPYLSDDASYRDAVREIAGAAGGFAQIIDNKLHIKWFENKTTELADWFSLTQEERTEPVNITVLGRGDLEDNIMYPSEAPDDPHELRIDDNQILFERERELIQPIFEQVEGFCYQIFSLRFVGLKDFKAGQRVCYHDIDGDLVETYVMTNSLSFCGGDYTDPKAWESTISSVQLNETATNYKYAGTVIKSVKNTEAKVDKTNQRIEFIVSEQQALENQVNENFTRVDQNITSVITSVQSSGGNNLIKNSAFYFKESNADYTYWEILGDGDIKVFPSAEVGDYGSSSGQVIRLLNKTIRQTISVKANDGSMTESNKTYYTFSCRINKSRAGNGSVIFSDGHNEWRIDIPNGEAPLYKEYVIEKMLPTSSSLTITVYGSSESDFSITDMMLAVGDYKTQWSQANGELANAQTQVDINGMKVSSSSTGGSNAQLSSQGLYTKSGTSIVSSLTNAGLVAPMIETTSGISMKPIRIAPQVDGWAFVPTN